MSWVDRRAGDLRCDHRWVLFGVRRRRRFHRSIPDRPIAFIRFVGWNSHTHAGDLSAVVGDWTADIRRYAADPVAADTLNALQTLVAAQVRQTVPPTFENPTVVSVDADEIVVESCLDATNAAAVNAAGESVLQPPVTPRVVVTVTLRLFGPADVGWLVSERHDTNQTC